MRYSYYSSQSVRSILATTASRRNEPEFYPDLTRLMLHCRAPNAPRNLRKMLHTLCAKLGITVIQILSAPTGRWGYAVIRK